MIVQYRNFPPQLQLPENLAELTAEYETTTSNVSVAMPLVFAGDTLIDWGDGTTETVTGSGWKEHTYASAGTYTATFDGAITRIWQSGTPDGRTDNLKRIISWGDSAITQIWLDGAAKLIGVPNYIPATVTSLNECFKLCPLINDPNISLWNTANVTDFGEVFKDAIAFNQPLPWDGSKGVNYERMIGGATAFNHPIDFIGGDNTVTLIDIADFARDASNWNGAGADLWAWEKIFGCANWALNAFKLAVDLSGVSPAICTNASNGWGFAGSQSTVKPQIPLDWPELLNAGGMLQASHVEQNLGGFRAPKMNNANKMLLNIANNTSDLSQWPVPDIPSRPISFADNSGIVAEPVWGTSPAQDVTAPTITSSPTISVNENVALAHSLTANENIFEWRVVGGADAAEFSISGSTLSFVSGSKDFEAPTDANSDNAYLVTVEAEDLSGNTSQQSITVTVADVLEGVGPAVEARATSVSVSANTASFTPTLPAGIVAGEMLVAAVLFDANSTPTLSVNTGASGGNWTKLAQDNASTFVGMAVFYKTAEGSDALQIDSTGSEQYSAVTWRISDAATLTGSFANSPTSSNAPAPPAHDAGTSEATLWLAIAAMDSDNATPNAAPSGYSNLTTQVGSSATGGSIGSAERTIVSQTETPGPFATPAPQEYVTATLAVRT